MSFVVSNLSERPGYHISMNKIKIIINFELNCIKIPINSCIHNRGYIPSGIIIPTRLSPSNEIRYKQQKIFTITIYFDRLYGDTLKPV